MIPAQNGQGAVIRVGGDLRIALDAVSAETVARLRAAARVAVRVRERRGGALRWVETSRDLSSVAGAELVLPRGLAAVVKESLGPSGQWEPATVSAPHVFASRIPYRPQQLAIADAVSRKVQGIALGATGVGKTGAACATIEKVQQRALILAPTKALAGQWRLELARFLGIDAGVSTGGEWSEGPVVIATPTTAMSYGDKLRDFGLLVVDEVQGFATERRCELIASIPARYRLGLTATLPRDHRGEILRAVVGPVLYRFGVADGIVSGALVAPRYEQVRTTFRAIYSGPQDWAALLDVLVEDRERNAQIVEIVARECAGVCTLVLSSRLAHLDVLRDLLTERGLRAAVLSGATPMAERESVLAAARAGQLDVVLGSVVADEGIDIPGLGALVLAFPSKAEGRLLQRIGRVVRALPGKAQPRIFDLVDDIGPLRRQAQLRRQAFERAFAQMVAA